MPGGGAAPRGDAPRQPVDAVDIGPADYDAFEKTLGIKKNEVTKDGQFHLVEEECIAACANAPCAVVGTKYILDITPDQVPQIVEELRRNPKPEGEVV